MGSLKTSPEQPIAPQAARAAGFSPSIPSFWPTVAGDQAQERVRLPALLAPAALLAMMYALSPRDAGAPSIVILLAGTMSSSFDAMSAWALALSAAAALAVVAILKRFASDTVGGSQ